MQILQRLRSKPQPASDAAPSRWRFLALTVLLMFVFYTALYHPWPEDSWAARCLFAYLEFVAQGSGTILRWLGERVEIYGTNVVGRFPYVVVLDCAALDAQALFAAAVLAFPSGLWPKVTGLIAGLVGIWSLNVARLVILYFAGTRSHELFEVLHEEVMVLLIILAVCGLFLAWASWARGLARSPLRADPTHAA